MAKYVLIGRTGSILSGGLSILLSTLGGLGVITILSGPHTFLQEHAKAVFQHHTLGLPTPVTVKMATIISEAAADCFPTTKSTESLAPYVCYGEEAKSFFGKNRPLMLGYPYYFAYETEDQVDVSNMVMAGKYKMPQVTDENAELIEQMRRSLCLSEDARRFLVARELIRGERKRYRIYTFMALGSVLAAAMACNMAHQALRLSKKNRSVRWSIYSAIVCALTGTFFLLKDRLQLIDERSLDTAVCSLGEPYARGGVEFYTKMLQRHLAQRHLMPDNKGTKLYNLKGDIYSGIILTGPTPVTQRKKSCEEQLQLFADAKRS